MENFGTLYIVQNTPGITEGARNGRSKIVMKKVNAMTEKQVEKFYNACPSGYGVEETRVFDLLSLQYITVSMRYIKLF